MAVVFHHLVGNHVYPSGWWLDYGYSYFLGTWLTNGWLGVSLFFMLSGFVLFLPYTAGKREFATVNDFSKFYRHRAKRLLPLYYISTCVALFILGDFWPHYNLDRAFAMVTITFNFFPEYFAPPANRPLWSLGIEVWYSILFPVVALLFKNHRAVVVLLIIIIVAYLTRVVGTDLGTRAIQSSLIARLGEFAFGMWIAKSWVEREWWTNWSYSTSLVVSVLGFVVMTFASLLYDFSGFLNLASWIGSSISLVFQIGSALLVMGLLVWGTRPNAYSWKSAWLLELLGMMCYSVYLWHVPLIGGLRPDITRSGEMTMYIVILMIFSFLSYRYIEFGHVKDWRLLLPFDPLKSNPGVSRR